MFFDKFKIHTSTDRDSFANVLTSYLWAFLQTALEVVQQGLCVNRISATEWTM